MNPKVDAYLAGQEQWKSAFEQLRTIVLDCPLEEQLKWGKPCYSFSGGNVVLMHGFKEYCALLFFKGALLKDPKSILVRQTENTQAARQIRFTSAAQVAALSATLKRYILEAIEVEKSGLEVTFKKTSEFAMPEEFDRKLDTTPALRAAFDALTPGRQRAYLLHFSEPKQSKTRESRIEKCMPKIFDGKGLNDQ